MYKYLLALILLFCVTTEVDAHRYYRHHYRGGAQLNIDITNRNRAYQQWRGNIHIQPRPQPYQYWGNVRPPYYTSPIYNPRPNIDIRIR